MERWGLVVRGAAYCPRARGQLPRADYRVPGAGFNIAVYCALAFVAAWLAALACLLAWSSARGAALDHRRCGAPGIRSDVRATEQKLIGSRLGTILVATAQAHRRSAKLLPPRLPQVDR